jgi:hypothetical protein
MNDENRSAQEIGKTGHEGIPETTKVCAIAHFFLENVGGINFTGNVFDVKSLILHPFVNEVVTKFDMTGSFRSHVVEPLDTRFIVIIKNVGAAESGISYPASETLRVRLQKSTTFLEVAFVALILASQELRDVRSWHSPSQPRGPPFLKTIPNLKSGSSMPSATELPN